ncbi:MAG TPA: UDP-N-acetylmuramate dehydrogenase [Thermoanaerobaculia bacterium]|nr:UDP-N-acetylmuramate dehydrogenase [Thermoanaerobaculia bacterium]
MKLRENVILAPYSTFRIGGPARYFVEASTRGEIEEGLQLAADRGVPLFILGGGSNLVIADAGFPGLVLHVALRGIESHLDGDRVLVTAGAGENWDDLVELVVRNDWAGFECLSGIPGSVGATPIQNVGAYGQEVKETIVEVTALDRQTGATRTFSNEECHFGYRMSRFKNEEPNRFLVVSVTYSLRPGGAPSIRYPDVQRYFTEAGFAQPTLQQVRDGVIEIRSRKGMVVRDDDPDSRSAGSFFMNPIVSEEEAERFFERARARSPRDQKIPAFEAAGGKKLSAAWLVENAGFQRGLMHGNVGISSKHTLALVNRGSGTARELMELRDMIQSRVRDVFGVELQPEPNFVGF